MAEPTPAAVRICLVDGQSQDVLPLEDRGLAYGDGLFETLRFREGKTPLWPLHWDRLAWGANTLGLNLHRGRLEQQLEKAMQMASEQGMTEGVAKLLVTRGEGGRGYYPATDAIARIVWILKPYRPSVASDGVILKSCSHRLSPNPVLAGLKHLNRLDHVLAARSVDLVEGQQGLLFDDAGCLVETLHHNLFLVQKGVLRTPDLSRCGVAGTLRRSIIETLAPAIDLETEVADLRAQDLLTADEVFICNAVQGVVPVTGWDDKCWHLGPITERVRRRLNAEWNNLYDN